MIQRCIDKGLKVILVTGRHHIAAYPYYHELNLTTPMMVVIGTPICINHKQIPYLQQILS